MKPEVAIVRCSNYDPQEVKSKIKKTLDLIGGIGKIVKKGEKVLLKPNLLSSHRPEKAVTTHPALVLAVAELVQEQGATVQIGDSPAGAPRGLENLWKETGIWEVAQKCGAELVNFEKAGAEEVKVEQGKVFKSLYITKPVLEADVLISLPKFKSHGETVLTGAVKNMLGVLPGLRKVEFHRVCPDPWDLGEALCDVLEVVKPDLTIMDGVLALEGEGPGGSGIPRTLGLILAGQDCLALDCVMSAVVGIEPAEVTTTKAGLSRWLYQGQQLHLENIEIKGEELDRVRVNNFIIPSNLLRHYLVKWLPEFLLKLVLKSTRIRPQARKSLCTECGLCSVSCPVGAIKTVANYPEVDYNKCIECLCCYEVCSADAMKLKRGLLLKIMRQVR